MADTAPNGGNLAEKQPEISARKNGWGGARSNSGGARAKAGRPKGSPNRLHGDVKAAIVEAFEKAGGVEYLVKVANTKPEVFCSLIGKVLPMQVTGEGGGPLIIKWGDG